MDLKNLLSSNSDNGLSNVKWQQLKQSIIKHLLSKGDATIAELSSELQASIPTITKAINELIEQNFVVEKGKVNNNGGRRPSLFTVIESCGYFGGVEILRSSISIGIQNLKNEFIALEMDIPFAMDNSASAIKNLCSIINQFIGKSGIPKSKVLGICVNLAGRVNSQNGYSHYYFFNENRPLSEMISENIGIPVYLENDTRAMTLGEFHQGVVSNEENIIFLNYSWGIGVGVVTNGQLCYGKSGYSGEFGHSSVFNNGKLCHCGKLGCLETEASGWALVSKFEEELKNGKQSLIKLDNSQHARIHFPLISGALKEEDSLCVDLITKQSELLGRYLSILVNILNPELLVIGGDFSNLGDLIILPIQAALRKNMLGFVNKDVVIKMSALGNKGGIIGACQLVKEKLLSAASL